MEWISVKDRLPTESGAYLVSYKFESEHRYFGVHDYYVGERFQHEGFRGLKVTHWMPLPEPPKEDV